MGVSIPVGFGQFTMPFGLTGDLEKMVVTLGFADNPAASANDIATTIQNIWYGVPTFAASSFPVQYLVGPGEVVVNRTLGTFQGFGTISRAGTGAQQVLPHNTAILIQKRTARGGRHGRGRMYLPPFPIAEGNVTVTGTLLESVRASIELDFQSILSQMIAVNLKPVLLHQAPPVGPAIPPDDITAFACSPLVATQRTRLRR